MKTVVINFPVHSVSKRNHITIKSSNCKQEDMQKICNNCLQWLSSDMLVKFEGWHFLKIKLWLVLE